MTGRLLPLFLCGTAAGGVSVFLFYLRRALAGEYPPRRFRFLLPEKQVKTKKRRGGVCGFFLDFFFCFLFGSYLVLYDASVLGGKGRLVHLGAFLCGYFIVRRVFLFFFFRPTERALRFLFDLTRFGARCLFYPIRKCFSILFGFLCSVYLILKRKNDRIKRKRKAKREIARLESDAGTAFLPAAVTEALASGRE